MKALLMHPERDFQARPPAALDADLRQDLELDVVLTAMAAGDARVLAVATAALLQPLRDREAIRFRQAVIKDCLANPEIVTELYVLAVESQQADRGVWGYWRDSPESILNSSRRSLELLIAQLHRLRLFADEHAHRFESQALRRLCAMLQAELSDDYFALLREQLAIVAFKHGVLISARLGIGNRGVDYALRLGAGSGWRERLARLRRPAHGFSVHPRDEAGTRALGDLQNVALNDTANALAQSVDHIESFFAMLSTELAFYIGCLNLHDQLAAIGVDTCLPDPSGDGVALAARELREVALSVKLGEPAVSNDVDAAGRNLLIITGANRGGKSTFLRSLGQAQLMMQCGMFVAASQFSADVRDSVFTHFKREEDDTMESGKLDEELRRMSQIAGELTPGGLLLCNESFAATNEREGSEIARQVVRALTEAGVKVAFVTHLFDFADGIRSEHWPGVLFLRAPPGDDGAEPSYRLVEGVPLPTSHGVATYRQVFGEPEGSDAAAVLNAPGS